MSIKYTFFSSKASLNLHGKLMDLSVPRIMGILNLTPDSFYDGGRYQQMNEACNRINQMIEQGMDILDIGGSSSRPGAAAISEKQEIARVFPVIQAIREKHPELPLSLDTCRAGIADRAIREFRVDMINDVSGGGFDHAMYGVIAEHQVPYVLMHMRGTPGTMQQMTDYQDILREMVEFFALRMEKLRSFGVKDVIIDPGFGFSKTLDQNFFLLRHLETFRVLDAPILTGISRKSMIYKHLGCPPDEALTGTIALNTIALLHGADLLRVHDVREARETISLVCKTFSN